MDLKSKGNLIVPDCTVNNGNPMETNFGGVEIQTLAAANMGFHWKNIRVPVNCPYSLGIPKELWNYQKIDSNAVSNTGGILYEVRFAAGGA